jgi:hypothetical protein
MSRWILFYFGWAPLLLRNWSKCLLLSGDFLFSLPQSRRTQAAIRHRLNTGGGMPFLIVDTSFAVEPLSGGWDHRWRQEMVPVWPNIIRFAVFILLPHAKPAKWRLACLQLCHPHKPQAEAMQLCIFLLLWTRSLKFLYRVRHYVAA